MPKCVTTGIELVETPGCLNSAVNTDEGPICFAISIFRDLGFSNIAIFKFLESYFSTRLSDGRKWWPPMSEVEPKNFVDTPELADENSRFTIHSIITIDADGIVREAAEPSKDAWFLMANHLHQKQFITNGEVYHFLNKSNMDMLLAGLNLGRDIRGGLTTPLRVDPNPSDYLRVQEQRHIKEAIAEYVGKLNA